MLVSWRGRLPWTPASRLLPPLCSCHVRVQILRPMGAGSCLHRENVGSCSQTVKLRATFRGLTPAGETAPREHSLKRFKQKTMPQAQGPHRRAALAQAEKTWADSAAWSVRLCESTQVQSTSLPTQSLFLPPLRPLTSLLPSPSLHLHLRHMRPWAFSLILSGEALCTSI